MYNFLECERTMRSKRDKSTTVCHEMSYLNPFLTSKTYYRSILLKQPTCLFDELLSSARLLFVVFCPFV